VDIKSRRGVTDAWTHRQAIQVVAMLPDDTEAALAVLDRARQLLLCWDQMPEPVTELVLVKT
jgi:hypothetical protein